MMPLFATAGLRSLAVPVSARDCGPRFAAVLALALARSSRFTVLGEERTLTGWLSLDRLGPVVSVLRHLEPVDRADHPTEDLAETRLAALGKLRPLLAELRGRR